MRASLYVAAAVAAFALSACKASFLIPGGGGTDAGGPLGSPEDYFDENVQPLVDSSRCANCHEDGGMGPTFLGPGSDYLTILGHRRASGDAIVVPGMPDVSAFFDLPSVAAGHAVWPDDTDTVVSTWILREGMVDPPDVDAGPPVMRVVTTDRVTPTDGTMSTIRLDSVGAPGAQIRFSTSITGTRLSLNNVVLSTSGDSVSITEPVLYRVDGGMEPELAWEFTERPNYRATSSSTVTLADRVVVDPFPDGGQLEFELGSVSATP